MKRITLGLIVGVLVFGPVAPSTAADLDRRFETSDGTLRFTYPGDWREYARDGYVSVLSPLVGPTPNGHLRDGEAKVEFYIGDNPPENTLARIKSRECNSKLEDARIVDCHITTFNGRSWLWVLKLEETFGGIWVRVVTTLENGRRYNGVGLVPSGEHYREGLAVTREILLSASVTPRGLAATGAAPLWTAFVSLSLLLAGVALRRAGMGSRIFGDGSAR